MSQVWRRGRRARLADDLWRLDRDALAALADRAQGRRAEALLHAAEGFVPPATYDALLHALPEMPLVASRRTAWAAQLAQGTGVARGFDHHPVSVAAHLYAAATAGPDGARDLLICLSGLKGRVGQPAPVILQALPPGVDLLLLSDPAREEYRRGVPGLAGDFAGLVQALRDLADRQGYRRRMVLGNSKGAVPALRLGLLAGFDGAAGLGPRPSNDALRLIAGQPVGTAFDPLCDCLAHRPLRGRAIHSRHHAEDSMTAVRLARHPGISAVAIAGLSGHNPMDALRKSGDLDRFLAELLADLGQGRRMTGFRPQTLRPQARLRAWLRRARARLQRLRGR